MFDNWRIPKVIVCLLIVGVVFLAAQAKASQFAPESSSTHYLSNTKMNESRVERVCAPVIEVVIAERPVPYVMQVPVQVEQPLSEPAVIVVGPVYFRPPPA